MDSNNTPNFKNFVTWGIKLAAMVFALTILYFAVTMCFVYAFWHFCHPSDNVLGIFAALSGVFAGIGSAITVYWIDKRAL